MRWIQKYHADLLNGEGLREVIFLSGCKHKCPGCFNPETWDFNKGTEWKEKDTEDLVKELRKDYISGVTFTGGDPLYNFDLINLLKYLSYVRYKEKLNFDIWVYTGFKFEYLLEKDRYFDFLINIDVLCDGPFIKELHQNNNKLWVGSSNQRVINVQESILRKKVVELENIYR